MAESVRTTIEQLKIPNKSSAVSPFITLSLGVSSMIPAQNLSADALIKDADNALYKAKTAGRNQLVQGQCKINREKDSF